MQETPFQTQVFIFDFAKTYLLHLQKCPIAKLQTLQTNVLHWKKKVENSMVHFFNHPLVLKERFIEIFTATICNSREGNFPRFLILECYLSIDFEVFLPYAAYHFF